MVITNAMGGQFFIRVQQQQLDWLRQVVYLRLEKSGNPILQGKILK
jgi:hypothetical protein